MKFLENLNTELKEILTADLKKEGRGKNIKYYKN